MGSKVVATRYRSPSNQVTADRRTFSLSHVVHHTITNYFCVLSAIFDAVSNT